MIASGRSQGEHPTIADSNVVLHVSDGFGRPKSIGNDTKSTPEPQNLTNVAENRTRLCLCSVVSSLVLTCFLNRLLAGDCDLRAQGRE